MYAVMNPTDAAVAFGSLKLDQGSLQQQNLLCALVKEGVCKGGSLAGQRLDVRASTWTRVYKCEVFASLHRWDVEWEVQFSFTHVTFHHHLLVKAHQEYSEQRVNVFVCDVTAEDLSAFIAPSSVDVVTLVFMLSAVSPAKMAEVIINLKQVLKPGGHVRVRDYEMGDLA
ncbi:unnamed protein product [Sphagnum jensenii]